MQCIYPKPRTFLILITFLDDNKRLFKIPIKQKGLPALINIVKSIQVVHKEYFGLKYLDKFDKSHWINLDKSLYQQLKKSQIHKSANLSNEPFYNLEFEVRYYPRDPTSVDDENFRYQIFLQIRKDLSSMKLIIKDETILTVLCGLILQSDHGDYAANRFAPHYVRETINSHLFTPILEEKIKVEHLKLRGVEPIEAEYRFLEKIRWLENYGTIIFPVKDINNKYCFLGLNPQGFSFRYQNDQNLNYEIFWPRVGAIKRKGRQIIIKEKTDITKKHYFETGEKLLCVSIYKLSIDHYAFFKLKKDEKPQVSEPPKRSFGRSTSKEFGYSSDTSDYNQYSDDTFSSYPDSINTTQSSKTTKVLKKTNVPSRNCISDVEESALSRKKRRVIVSKSQTETEDEGFRPYEPTMKNNTFDFRSAANNVKKTSISQSQSYDRIPPDYIYENRLSKVNTHSEEPIRQKRMRKKAPNQTNMERNLRENKEVNQNTFSDANSVGNKKSRSPSRDTRINESGVRQMKSRSGEFIDPKPKIQRKLPLPNALPQSFEFINKTDNTSSDYRMNQSASIDGILKIKNENNRVSPTKRMLPNISAITSSHQNNPPIPTHRIQPIPPNKQDDLQKNNSIYAELYYKPAYTNPPPRVPQHSNIILRNTYQNRNIPEKPQPIRNYRRPSANNQQKLRPESGI